MKKHIVFIFLLLIDHTTLHSAAKQHPDNWQDLLISRDLPSSDGFGEGWIDIEMVRKDEKENKAGSRVLVQHVPDAPSAIVQRIPEKPLGGLLELAALPAADRINILAAQSLADREQWTTAHQAAFAGDQDFFAKDLGSADLLVLSPGGFSPLHLALIHNPEKQIAHQILDQISNSGLEIAALTHQSNFYEFSMLSLALLCDNFSLIQTIVARLFYLTIRQNSWGNSALNQAGIFDVTPLHLACMLGNRVHIALLAVAGGNFDSKDSYNKAPLSYLRDEAFKQELADFIEAGGWLTYTRTRQHYLEQVGMSKTEWAGFSRRTVNYIRLACCNTFIDRQSLLRSTCPKCQADIPLRSLMLIHDQAPFNRPSSSSCCAIFCCL